MHSSRIERIMYALTEGRIVEMKRFRTVDNAEHRFTFQLFRHKDPQYLLIEEFENGTVQEEFVDIEAILLLCNWLLKLKFKAKIIDLKTRRIQ